MTKIVKLDLGDERGSIWIEADEIDDEKRATRPSAGQLSGRESVGLRSDAAATLTSAFEQFTQVFEIAHAKLIELAHKAQETSIEINATLSTEGNLIIVKGSTEASIKIVMKWSASKDGHE
jgi:hypothetical protein